MVVEIPRLKSESKDSDLRKNPQENKDAHLHVQFSNTKCVEMFGYDILQTLE